MNIRNIIESEYNKLGGGAFGSAYEKDGLLYKVTKDEKEVSICNKILKSNKEFIALPKIFKVRKGKNRYIIVREILTMLKPTYMAKVANMAEHINEYMFENSQSSKALVIKFLDKKFVNFLDKLKEELTEIDSFNKFIDIHSENIGINKSGNLILFDF
jgi:hypothetical protein